MKAMLVLLAVLLLLACAVALDLITAGLLSSHQMTLPAFVGGLTAFGLLAIAWLESTRRKR
jgi:hypothetical protein